jgi:hypothetical protein
VPRQPDVRQHYVSGNRAVRDGHRSGIPDQWCFPCVGRLWTAAPEASARARRGSALPMRVHDRLAPVASLAFGDRRVIPAAGAATA